MANRPKMSRQERAKQFMPFAALKGYPEALARKEKVALPRAEVSEEYAQELDWKLRRVKKTGMVSRIDETARVLKVVNTKIGFDDIYDIELCRDAMIQ